MKFDKSHGGMAMYRLHGIDYTAFIAIYYLPWIFNTANYRLPWNGFTSIVSLHYIDNTSIISLKVKISGPIASISFETISFDITLNINSATSIACIGVNFVSPL